jgi:hypothetical protein
MKNAALRPVSAAPGTEVGADYALSSPLTGIGGEKRAAKRVTGREAGAQARLLGRALRAL